MPEFILLPVERARQQRVKAQFDALARETGLTVKAVAARAEMSRQHTSQLLNGSRFTKQGMTRLEEALEEIAAAEVAG